MKLSNCLPTFLILLVLYFLLRKPTIEGVSDCQWSGWGPWTECSESCGGGEQSRARANNGGCGEWPDDRNTQTRLCNGHLCPRGETGGSGDQGEAGIRGPRGYKGEQGKSIEVRGATGEGGFPGPKGEVGDIGERGAQGPPGPRGPSGLLINRGNRLKHDLAKIYNTLRLVNTETASKEYIQKTIGDGEGMTTMKAYNTGSYF
jgi:hypothetical protein